MQFLKRSPTSNGSSIFALTSAPKCLKCREHMSVTLLAPLMFVHGIDQITYTCLTCGREQRRTVPHKSDD